MDTIEEEAYARFPVLGMRRAQLAGTLSGGEQQMLAMARALTTEPNALLLEALTIMKAWGFTYKTNLVWYKVRKDGGPDGRGVGFYFRNVTELVLFGTRGSMRTLEAAVVSTPR